MESGWNWNLFNNSSSSSTNGGRGQNGNSTTNTAWDIWDLGNNNTSRFDWNNTQNSFNHDNTATVTTTATATAITNTSTYPDESEVHALMFSHQFNNGHHSSSSSTTSASLYNEWSHFHYQPDPHLMCLKLGKRHYFEDANALGDRHVAAEFSITKRNKPYYINGGGDGGNGFVGPSSSTVMNPPAAVPRCQVEGCHVALVNAKDYHRRHKVCDMHSKAPKVVVLGLEQRFCQQCSRFHAVAEFDDTKRSCRRRLAGHNERRRKSSHDHSGPKTSSQALTGRALSLLSMKNDSMISSDDISSRSSAALHELIAENRAAILARQLILDRDWHWYHHSMEDLNGTQIGSNSFIPHQHQMFFQ